MLEKEFWHLIDEEYVLKRERGYLVSELNCMTAEVRQHILELIKNDHEQEAAAVKKEQNRMPMK